jgi:hypothetical protein
LLQPRILPLTVVLFKGGRPVFEVILMTGRIKADRLAAAVEPHR